MITVGNSGKPIAPALTRIALAFCSVALAASAHAQQSTLTETGSTLLAPLFTTWSAAYEKTHPQVHITVGATGSGAGIEQAVGGKVNIGASDAYMSDADTMKHPQVINVPLAIAAQTVNYNVPGLNDTHLRLDGPTLAAIYSGTIRQWDAPAIAALNPGVHLPHHDIVPVHRGDGSGDTFVFTQFLTFSTPAWESALGYDTTIAWPTVPGALAATGNAGMVNTLKATPYSVGYIGVSYAADIDAAKLGTAALKNGAGEFVLPTKENITAGAASLAVRTPPDERLSLVFSPASGTYPLVNYEYAIVSKQQPNAVVAAQIREFLAWTIVPSEENAGYLRSVHFIALPPHTWELSYQQIQSIK